MSDARRRHILDGDGKTSGGHRWGVGKPEKTEFPWWASDDGIIAAVERIANDPKSYPGGCMPCGPTRAKAIGHMVGPNGEVVTVKVVVDPKTCEVITAHPINLPRNPPTGW